MTELSSNAKALMEAWWNDSNNHQHGIGTVIRTVAEELIPKAKGSSSASSFDNGYWLARMELRHKLLSIASELEGHGPPSV